MGNSIIKFEPLFLITMLLLSLIFSQQTLAFDHTSLRAGYGYTRVGNSQNIWLNKTPIPGLENNYSSGDRHDGTFILAITGEQTVKNYRHVVGDVGITAMFLRNPSMQGVVKPMVNVAPDFDTLTYTYDMNSYLIMLTGKVSANQLLEQLGAYLEVNGGIAVNDLFNYTESSPINSTAAPMLKPFGNHTIISIAYSAGLGVQYRFHDAFTMSVGYLYINTGYGALDTTPIQQTGNHLKFSPLASQFIVFTLTV